MDKDIPGVYALSLIAILQFLNISFVGLLLILFDVITDVTKTSIIVIIVLLLIANYLYIYKKKGREQILRQYSGNTEEIKKVRKFSLLYILISLLSFLGLFIYFLLNKENKN